MNGSRWIAVSMGVAAALSITLLAGCASTSQQVGAGGKAAPKMPIRLVASQGPVPRLVNVSRKIEEEIWFHDDDARGHTIRFTDWPFREPQQDIFVEAGRDSRRFHVYKNQDTGTYSYTVKPSLGDKDGPPDPPAFVVGD